VALGVGVLLATAGPAAAAAPAGGLVIGDSLEVGSAPYLEAALGAVSVEIDHRTGRGSAEGVSVLRARLRPDHAVVVFDLGTNDDPRNPGALYRNLATVRERAGNRCRVVATVLRPPVNGVTADGLNAAIERFAAETPTVHVVDWRAAAGGRPGLLYPDGIHPRPEGYSLRGRMLARAIKACLGLGAQGLPPPPASTRAPPARAPLEKEPAEPQPPEPKPTEPKPPAVRLPDLGTPAALGALAAVMSRSAGVLAAAWHDARQATGFETPEPVLGAPGR
jgi:lysophospholipase L1-like esterase